MKFSVNMWPAGTPSCFRVLSKLPMKGCGPHMYTMRSCTPGTCTNKAPPQVVGMHELTKDGDPHWCACRLLKTRPTPGRTSVDRASTFLHTGCGAEVYKPSRGHATCQPFDQQPRSPLIQIKLPCLRGAPRHETHVSLQGCCIDAAWQPLLMAWLLLVAANKQDDLGCAWMLKRH